MDMLVFVGKATGKDYDPGTVSICLIIDCGEADIVKISDNLLKKYEKNLEGEKKGWLTEEYVASDVGTDARITWELVKSPSEKEPVLSYMRLQIDVPSYMVNDSLNKIIVEAIPPDLVPALLKELSRIIPRKAVC